MKNAPIQILIDSKNKSPDQQENRLKQILKKIADKLKVTKFDKLGKGGYGAVFQATIQNKRYAIKIIDTRELIDRAKPEDKETNRKMIDNECLYLLSLNNKNILKGISRMVFPEDGFIVILIVFCENLDLNFINKLYYQKKLFKNVIIEEPAKNGDNNCKSVFGINNCLSYPGESFLRFFAVQILNGFKYLNECGLVHCDLKLNNILVTRDFILKIADFGTMKSKRDYKLFPNISTKAFQSVEFALGIKDQVTEENVHKYDMFSFGALIYKFFTNSYYIDVENFEKNKKMEYYEEIYNKKILQNDYLNKYPKLKSLLEGLLHCDISKRFNIQQTLDHDWFNLENEGNKGQKVQINYKYFSEMHDNDSIKMLLELQKIDYSDYLRDRVNINIFREYEVDNNQNEDLEYEIAPLTYD